MASRLTEQEKSVICWEGGKMSVRELSRRLGRPISSIVRVRQAAGITSRIPCPPRPRLLDDEVRRLHAEGRNDREIAAALNVGSWRVVKVRNRLGLSPQGYTAGVRQKQREGHLQNSARKAAEFATTTGATGWPQGLRIIHLRLLECLWSNGPMTRRELADALGVRYSLTCFPSGDPEADALRHVVARGLVQVIGKVGLTYVYSIPLWYQKGAVA